MSRDQNPITAFDDELRTLLRTRAGTVTPLGDPMTEIALRGSLRQRQRRTFTMAGAAVAAAAAAAAIIFGGPLLYNDDNRDRGLPAQEQPTTEKQGELRELRDGEVAATVQILVNGPDGAFAAFDHVFVRARAKTLVKIDPRTNDVVTSIELKDLNLREGVAPVASAGALWYPGENEVVRVDPDLKNVATIKMPTPVVAGDGERVWAATSDGRVAEIDTRTNRLGRAVRHGGTPDSMTFAAGRIWTADEEGVARIDPDTLQWEDGIALDSAPRSMVGVGDTVWISLPYTDQLAVLTADAESPELVQLPKGRDEFDPVLAANSDGKTVWSITNGNELVAVDASTKRVVDHIHAYEGMYPVEVAVDGNTVWVPTNLYPEVMRLEWQPPNN
jgi:outer membrane protein assembly factor BamB